MTLIIVSKHKELTNGLLTYPFLIFFNIVSHYPTTYTNHVKENKVMLDDQLYLLPPNLSLDNVCTPAALLNAISQLCQTASTPLGN